jgi:hypothetical protein
MAGWGLSAGALLAAGPEGALISMFGTSYFGNGSTGVGGGPAAGVGLGVSGLLTYTRLETVVDFSQVPDAVIDILWNLYDKLPSSFREKLRLRRCP